MLRIFHYSPWYTYSLVTPGTNGVENLSLFALIYLETDTLREELSWESFIIRLDILMLALSALTHLLRIFHYSPWYTYYHRASRHGWVENLSLFALIYLRWLRTHRQLRWESFIIRLDILNLDSLRWIHGLRIFHYSPWYTYPQAAGQILQVENLSLFALIYLIPATTERARRWESFIIRLDILKISEVPRLSALRIFHYSPWYT